MAKKKISLSQLQVGMFMEMDVKAAAGANKNVLLLGKGILITSETQIRRLQEAGLKDVIIDTSKGKDVAGGSVVNAPAPPSRPPQSPGPRPDARPSSRMRSRSPARSRGPPSRWSRSSWATPPPGGASMSRRWASRPRPSPRASSGTWMPCSA
ncbi:MAG: DUF3391 domain-containing protein [Candidatus Latescibacteria bacterium]|nr:DUF3391 domain-containing protein [Candidatus Latescibacterota bacterium]